MRWSDQRIASKRDTFQNSSINCHFSGAVSTQPFLCDTFIFPDQSTSVPQKSFIIFKTSRLERQPRYTLRRCSILGLPALSAPTHGRWRSRALFPVHAYYSGFICQFSCQSLKCFVNLIRAQPSAARQAVKSSRRRPGKTGMSWFSS